STEGNTVHYTPPAVTSAADAVISASSAGATESVQIALRPASDKALQFSQTSVQAGQGTVTAMVPSTVAHGPLQWSVSPVGMIAGTAPAAFSTPPATRAAPPAVRVPATDGTSRPFTGSIVVLPSVTLSINPTVASTTAAGNPVSLTASVANTS